MQKTKPREETQALANGTFVEHFPGNLRWSNATQIVKGMAPWGVVSLVEIDILGDKMKKRAAAGDDLDTIWIEEWSALASRLESVADEAAADDRQVTAGHNYMRAGNYYYSAERFIRPGDRKMAMYHKSMRCFSNGLERVFPQISKVDVPYEDGALAAYFVTAPGAEKNGPTAVIFDGLDNCKEMSVIFAGLELAKRGINTLAIDGPGQGESLRLRNFRSRYDYEVAGAAAYDYVADRPEVDPKRVAVIGYSFGGYFAPRIASIDKRYAACVAFGAMWADVAGWYRKLRAGVADDPARNSHSTFQLKWVLGTEDDEELIRVAEKFTLEEVGRNMTCPFLVLHGENDRLVPVSEAHTLFGQVGSKTKELVIFRQTEGGAEHCQVDHRQMGMDVIGDFLLKHL